MLCQRPCGRVPCGLAAVLIATLLAAAPVAMAAAETTRRAGSAHVAAVSGSPAARGASLARAFPSHLVGAYDPATPAAAPAADPLRAGAAQAAGGAPAGLADHAPLQDPARTGGFALLVPGAAALGDGSLIGRALAAGGPGAVTTPVAIRHEPETGQPFVTVGPPFATTLALGANAAGIAIATVPRPEARAAPGAPAPLFRRTLAEAESVAGARAQLLGTTEAPYPAAVAITGASGEIARLSCAADGCRPAPDHPAGTALVLDAWSAAISDATPARPGLAAVRHARAESALRELGGSIYTTALAAVMRSRAPHGSGNAAVPGHAGITTAAIADLADGVIWLGTARAPLAAFGRYTAVPIAPQADRPAPQPADPWYDDRRSGEAIALNRLRQLVAAHEAGATGYLLRNAAQLRTTKAVNPPRMAWLEALAHMRSGDPATAADALARLEARGRMPADIAVHAALLRARIHAGRGATEARDAALAEVTRRLDTAPGAEPFPQAARLAQDLAAGEIWPAERLPHLQVVVASP